KPKGAASKNGTRQPHDSICGVVRLAVSTVAINEPNNKPAAVEPGTTEAYRPRLLAGAYSTRKAEAPAYSPEAVNPCSSRHTSNMAGAQRPSWAAPGKSPLQTVAPDMIRIDHARAVLRPTRSTIWPQVNPPMGRTKKGTANSAKVHTSPSVRSSEGKNTVAITTAR